MASKQRQAQQSIAEEVRQASTMLRWIGPALSSQCLEELLLRLLGRQQVCGLPLHETSS